MFQVDEFVLNHIFHKIETLEGTIAYYRQCIDDPDSQWTTGWIVLYEDGQHLHTYHNPENWM